MLKVPPDVEWGVRLASHEPANGIYARFSLVTSAITPRNPQPKNRQALTTAAARPLLPAAYCAVVPVSPGRLSATSSCSPQFAQQVSFIRL
jgi:hypothetical protein